MNTDDSHCEVNIIVVLNSEGENFAFTLTAMHMVNLEKILNKQNRAEKLPYASYAII